MEVFDFQIKRQPNVILRSYATDKLIDICWRYEQADISYKMAVNEVKVQCALNFGLAEHKLYEALTKRGNRLPMTQTRLFTENTRQEKQPTKREAVKELFNDAKHLKRK